MNLEALKIGFYEGKYYLLCNFSAHKVLYEGFEYMTAEHAYQAAKFDDPEIRKKIIDAPSAFLAREYGQSDVGRKIVFDKVAEMKKIMREKMLQHADVKKILLLTGDDVIEKNHPDDYFWGTGADGTGQNKMGVIWMELRSELK